MAYRVKLTERSLSDIEDFVGFVTNEKMDPGGALKWYDGLMDAIVTLEELPERCRLISERLKKRNEIRQLLYHSHRIVFEIMKDDSIVFVLRVYHTSRRALKNKDLQS